MKIIKYKIGQYEYCASAKYFNDIIRRCVFTAHGTRSVAVSFYRYDGRANDPTTRIIEGVNLADLVNNLMNGVNYWPSDYFELVIRIMGSDPAQGTWKLSSGRMVNTISRTDGQS